MSDFEVLESIGKFHALYNSLGEGTSGKVFKVLRNDFLYAMKKTKLGDDVSNDELRKALTEI